VGGCGSFGLFQEAVEFAELILLSIENRAALWVVISGDPPFLEEDCENGELTLIVILGLSLSMTV
jgi:hypothetical protein